MSHHVIQIAPVSPVLEVKVSIKQDLKTREIEGCKTQFTVYSFMELL